MKNQVISINRKNLGMLTALGVSLFLTVACTQENSPTKLTDTVQTQREIFTIVEEQPNYCLLYTSDAADE